MSTAASDEPRIVSVEVAEDSIAAVLADGRTISVPSLGRGAYRTPLRSSVTTLRSSVPARRALADIDEDISARGMLQGVPARPPKQAVAARG